MDLCAAFMKPSRFDRFASDIHYWKFRIQVLDVALARSIKLVKVLMYITTKKNTVENGPTEASTLQFRREKWRLIVKLGPFLVTNAAQLSEMTSFPLVISCWMLCAVQLQKVDMSIKLQVTRL